jgi:hypothetical protein
MLGPKMISFEERGREPESFGGAKELGQGDKIAVTLSTHA